MTKHADAAEAVEKTDLDISIEEVTYAVAEITKMDQVIAGLTDKYAKVIFDVETPAGLSDAKAARKEIREPRYLIERLRKEGKRPILDLGRQLDNRAGEMTDRLLMIEGPIDSAIKKEESRAEREREAKIAAELKRVEAIKERIANIRSAIEDALRQSRPADHLAQWISDIEAEPIDESFEEFRQQAQDAKDATLGRLRELHTAAVAREEEEKKIAAERAELEKLRAEQAKRDEEDRKRREAEEAAAEKKRKEEEAKKRAELAEQQKKLDEENDRLAKEKIKEARRQEIQNQINIVQSLPAQGYGKTAAGLSRLLARAQGFTISLHEDDADMAVAAANAQQEATSAIKSMLEGRKKFEAERAEEQAARERNEMAMQEIQAIQHQVMIARTGRSGHVKGGTVEGVDKLIAETESWDITPEKFGALTASAEAAKQSAISNLKQYRADLVREQEEKVEAEREAKAEAAARKKKFPGEAAIINALVQHFGITEKLARTWLSEYSQARAA